MVLPSASTFRITSRLPVEVDFARGAQEIEQIPALPGVSHADKAAKATARVCFVRRPQAEVPNLSH